MYEWMVDGSHGYTTIVVVQYMYEGALIGQRAPTAKHVYVCELVIHARRTHFAF